MGGSSRWPLTLAAALVSGLWLFVDFRSSPAEESLQPRAYAAGLAADSAPAPGNAPAPDLIPVNPDDVTAIVMDLHTAQSLGGKWSVEFWGRVIVYLDEDWPRSGTASGAYSFTTTGSLGCQTEVRPFEPAFKVWISVTDDLSVVSWDFRSPGPSWTWQVTCFGVPLPVIEGATDLGGITETVWPPEERIGALYRVSRTASGRTPELEKCILDRVVKYYEKRFATDPWSVDVTVYLVAAGDSCRLPPREGPVAGKVPPLLG